LKRAVALLIAWTVIWLLIVIVAVPPQLNVPTCAHVVSRPATCADSIAAENARVWWTESVPELVVLVVGWLVVAVWSRRERR
jgi:hypothetical protein